MCILCVSVLQNKRYPFVLLDNREEEARPTTDVGTHFEEVYCAVDKKAGGTWCGLNQRTGVFAVLTNASNPDQSPDADSDSDLETEDEEAITSRGILVTGILTSKVFVPDQPAEEVWRGELDEIKGGCRFRGFNLVFGNLFGKEPWAVYSTNTNGLEALAGFPPCENPPPHPLKAGSASLQPQSDGSGGTFCVSNSYMNDWTWPKVKWLAEQTDQATKEGGEKDPKELNEVLSGILSRNDLNFPDSSHPPCVLRPNDPVREEQLRTRQRNPFILETEGDPHRTLQQTIIIVEAPGPDADGPPKVHYFYRDCPAEKPTKADWDSTPWTAATFPKAA